MKRPKKDVIIILVMIVVVLFSAAVRYTKIKGGLPYIAHPDEPGIAKTALTMIQTGDFNPKTFMYPSVTYYLTAATFVFGFFNSVAAGDVKTIGEVGRVDYPFYSEYRLVFPSKLLFALLSLLGMVLVGLIASDAFENKHMLYLVPLLLSLSALYLFHSVQYLNVDIVACFFATLAVFYVVKKLDIDSFAAKAVFPGIFTGIAVGSKYTYLLVIFPAVLSIIFFSKEQKTRKILVLGLVTVLAFLVCVPYSLLDFDRFLDSIALEIYTYGSSHPGFTGKAGLSQFFFYGRALIDEYGLGFMAFALLGIVFSLVSNVKKGLILLSFPLIFLLYMSAYPVNFLRNVLAVFIFVCLYAALGIAVAMKYLGSKLASLKSLSNRASIQKAVPVILTAAAILIFLPFKRILNAYDLKPDSRNAALGWIESNVPPNSTVFIAQELGLDTRELKDSYDIRLYDGFKSRGGFQEFLPGAYVFFPHYGHDDRFPEQQELSFKLNESFKNMKKIFSFGKRPVLVNYPIPSPMGNPRFYVAKYK